MFVLLALLLHGLVAVVFLALPIFSTKRPQKEVFNVSMVDLSELPNLPKLDRPPPVNPLKKQVIEQAPPKNAERPDKADYLSEHNQKVDKQTQSRNKGPKLDDSPPGMRSKNAQAAPPQQQPPSERAAPEPSDDAPAEQDIAADGILTAPKRGKKPKTRTAWVKDLRQVDLFADTEAAPQAPQAPQPSASPDYIKDVPSDAETRLNAWEWKHASFFNRMKNAVAKVWSPQQQIQRFDPQMAQLGRQDRLTVVTVTIDRTGRVQKVGIEKESGVGYLDDEATRAFYAAGPFPNPPEALFEGADHFTFSFGFYLSLERGWGIHFGG